jgi:hypothetical protein
MANLVAESVDKEGQLPLGREQTQHAESRNTRRSVDKHTQVRWQTHACEVATTHVKFANDTRVVSKQFKIQNSKFKFRKF